MSAHESALVRCPVVTRVRLAAGGQRIELRTDLHNLASDHRLRVLFPTPGPARSVRAEGHFAVIERLARPVWNGHWHEPPADTGHTLGACRRWTGARGLPAYEAVELPDGGSRWRSRCFAA